MEDAQEQVLNADNNRPIKGSIIVFGPTERNNAGHVAYVESVSEENFTISQMNAGSTFTPGTLKTEYFGKVTMDSLSIGQTHYKGMNVLGLLVYHSFCKFGIDRCVLERRRTGIA